MRLVLRLETRPEKHILKGRRPNQGLASLGAALSWPFGVFCFFVCLWRWSYDLGWLGRFLVTDGILLHWQVWFVAGVVLLGLGFWLERYARPGLPGIPEDTPLRESPPASSAPEAGRPAQMP